MADKYGNILGIWQPTPKHVEQPVTERLVASDTEPKHLKSGRVSVDSSESGYSTGIGLLSLFAQDRFSQDYKLDVRSMETMSTTKLMELLATYSPDISRALWDFLRLSNPGWECKVFNPGTDTISDKGQTAVDTFIARMAGYHGSMDVVFNRLFMSAFLRGALLSELVLDKQGRMPVELVTPDPSSVTFRKIPDKERGDIWQLGQWQKNEFIPLDAPTIRYVAVDPLPGSPFGRSLASPALFTSLFLLGMLHDLRRVVAQQGYPRPDIVIDTEKLRAIMPANVASDPAKLIEWSNAVIAEVSRAYGALEPDDAFIHTDVVKHERPVGTVDSFSLSGLEGLVRILERMAVRSLKTLPLLYGTSDAGEANANRQWEIYAAGIKSLQHSCEQLLEYDFTLALQAQGIQADVKFRFAEMRAAELLRDAQVEAFKIKNARALYDNGTISADEMAERSADKEKADVPEPRAAASSMGNALPSGGIAADPGSERALYDEYVFQTGFRVTFWEWLESKQAVVEAKARAAQLTDPDSTEDDATKSDRKLRMA